MRLFSPYSLLHASFVKKMIEQNTMNGILFVHVLKAENEE